ncbi:MAG: ArsR family transcriptional regulator, partial [Pseudomonadota bacterium]
MAYADMVRESRRLAILQVLNEDPLHGANQAVMQRALSALGLAASMDAVRADLAWLAEQGLCTVQSGERFTVGVITQRGQDAATGV